MKFRILFLVLIFAFISCNKEFDQELTPINEDVAKTDAPTGRLKASYNSVDFDWENTDYITINGVNVALPWQGGGGGVIPEEVRNDHKKANGWKLVYNTIDYIYHTSKLNYLIFYNVLTGRVRIFYYAINPTGNNSVWNFHFEGGYNSLTNSVKNFAEPISEDKWNPFLQTSNIAFGDNVSGIYPGWNCFEVELAYDSNLKNKNDINFGVYSNTYDVTNIVLNGTFNSKTSGQIVVPGTSNPFSSYINAFAKKSGESAKGWLTEKKNTGEFKVGTALLNLLIAGGQGLTGQMVTSGIAGVFNKFLGKFSSSKPTIQQVKLSTQGNFSASGTLQSSAPDASVEPLGALLVPGSKISQYDGLLPTVSTENIEWGAWNLSSSPVVKYSKNAYYYYYGSEDLFEQRYNIDNSSIHLVLNPALSSAISSYNLKTELWYYKEYGNSTTWNGSWRPTPKMIPQDESGTLVYKDNENEYIRYCHSILHESIWFYGRDLPQSIPMMGYDNRFVVKVYLTVYPKAPYSTEPIVMVRSFVPNYVGY